MDYLDLSLPTPEENLACDEALLDLAEEGHTGEVLRFWESPTYFVVAGYSNKISLEVNMDSCASDNIKILRRISGGGTVLQGPGCLNYALILDTRKRPELATVTSANRAIMEQHRKALGSLLGIKVFVEGDTDLALSNAESNTQARGQGSFDKQSPVPFSLKKFSGNAQRRRKHFLLFHGTFLTALTDLLRMERYLKAPSKAPAYRNQRNHEDFLAVLEIPSADIQKQLRAAWQAVFPLKLSPLFPETLRNLKEKKYLDPAWNRKF